MPVEIALNTPLADALNSAIQPKLVEVGWGSGGADDSALSEYIILMLVNGKTQDEIAAELSGDLLNLGPDDPGAKEFSTWLFENVDTLNAQLGSANAPPADGSGDSAVAQDDLSMGMDRDADMNMSTDSPLDLNAPTGPKAMRQGGVRGGREKRMMGQITRAMDRATHENALHRVRGQTGSERINSHGRTPPSGPRMGVGRQPRSMNGRAASIAHGLVTGMGGAPTGPAGLNGGMSGGMNGMNGWMMPPPAPPGQPVDIFAMLEQQSRMMQQMQQQMLMQQQGGFRNNNHGKPLSERVNNHRNNFRKSDHQGQSSDATKPAGNGEDVEMSQTKREPPNSEETVCKFNLRCTNKDCKFAHQSPVAPPGTTIDVNDVCSYGAACKNRKCVGRHPSPATKVAHQSEQDCKFFPNCQNPQCQFRHPNMPLCRNGGDCSTADCKFTHVQTMCKFHPCTNRYCTFKHEDGQRGTFQDKVWTAGGAKGHVSERKFVDESAPADVVLPDDQNEVNMDQSLVQEDAIV